MHKKTYIIVPPQGAIPFS